MRLQKEKSFFYDNIRVEYSKYDLRPVYQEIMLEGCDAEHTLNGVKFRGIYRNGKRITDEGIVRTNEFVQNISFE